MRRGHLPFNGAALLGASGLQTIGIGLGEKGVRIAGWWSAEE